MSTTEQSFNLFGTDLFGDPVKRSYGILADKFTCPPISVIDTRQGYWQDRKRAWLSLGIKGEKGRDAQTFHAETWLKEKAQGFDNAGGSDLSVFDPTLCEVAYSWFTLEGDTILDPFAGGSVRGIVASCLSREYVGIELRREQVAENVKQASAICGGFLPRWIVGDAVDVVSLTHPLGTRGDFIFSCPPYWNLEKYSNDPRDLSTMLWGDFLKAYRSSIKNSAYLLRDDRFACFVVGDVRDKAGRYVNLPGETVRAFEDAGLTFYNEAILVKVTGSMPLRAAKQFESSRKIGKTHQQVYVFVKGDPRRATARLNAQPTL